MEFAEEGLILEEFVGGPAGGDPAVFEDEDFIAEPAEPADVVVDDEDGAPVAGMAEPLEEGELLDVVDAGGRLVEEEEARVAQEAAAQRKKLSLAAGKFVSGRKRPIEELGGAEILAKIPLEDGPDAGQFAGLHQLVVGGGGGGQQEVVADRVG